MNKAILSLFLGLTQGFDIVKDCGAVAKGKDTQTLKETQQNAAAIMSCLDKANSDPTDRTVVIPKGQLFSSMPIEASGLNDVTLTIDGVLEVC
jgi:hypothetical protein